MSIVVVFKFAEDWMIVSVHHYEIINAFTKYLVHQRLESCRCIICSHWHYWILKLSVLRVDGRLFNVLVYHPNLIKTCYQVNLRNDIQIFNWWKHLFWSRNRRSIVFCDAARSSVINKISSSSWIFHEKDSARYGDVLLQMFPFLNKSSLYSFASRCSTGDNWYKEISEGFIPASTLILWFTNLLSRSPKR